MSSNHAATVVVSNLEFTEWNDALSGNCLLASATVDGQRLSPHTAPTRSLVQAGNFGDCEPDGEGVIELRVHVGGGYHVLRPARQSGGAAAVRWRQRQPDSGYQAGKGTVVGMEKETGMSKLKGTVSHHEAELAELRADRELAVEYLKVAMASLDDPNDRSAGLLALRTVAEAYGGLGAVAAEAGISRESLYRALSPKGNPTLRTLLAVLRTVGLRLSVEPENHAHA